MDMNHTNEESFVWINDSNPYLSANPYAAAAQFNPLSFEAYGGNVVLQYAPTFEDTAAGFNAPTVYATSEDIHTEADNSQINSAIQAPYCRKIKPFVHPRLKLQTPIAYQHDTDLNVIPIQKDGRAVCEKCGAIGVKHAFYTRERRYCSMACARGSTEFIEANSEQRLEEEHARSQRWMPSQDPELSKSFLWPSSMLDQPDFCAVPTYSFKHAPMSDCWQSDITVGMKVEVENTDSYECDKDASDSTFWIATIVKIEGYKGKLRYEGFLGDSSLDFWVTLCQRNMHACGWCSLQGKPLIPPTIIKEKNLDMRKFLKEQLTGAHTLPGNYASKVQESLKCRFRCELMLEVIDKRKISQVKVATIIRIIGKRLQLKYYDDNDDDDGNNGEEDSDRDTKTIWRHEDSPEIHPVGWAHHVGHDLDATPEYKDRVSKGLRDKDDATADLFPISTDALPAAVVAAFKPGYKFEAVDPEAADTIGVATVTKVLNDGYVMIKMDHWEEEESEEEGGEGRCYCYHAASPYIFPAGFCQRNGIPLRVPTAWTLPVPFDWNAYLRKTGSSHVSPIYFPRTMANLGFIQGSRLEAGDAEGAIWPARVEKVVAGGRLLKILYEGGGGSGAGAFRWADCGDCDIYPVGWCELVYHKLEWPGGVRETAAAAQEVDYDQDMEEEFEEDDGGEDDKNEEKVIPAMTDDAAMKTLRWESVVPQNWDVNDVSTFLQLNDCSAYRDIFAEKGIDGKQFLDLKKEDVLALTGKVGPSLKIHNLIYKLVSKTNPSYARLHINNYSAKNNVL